MLNFRSFCRVGPKAAASPWELLSVQGSSQTVQPNTYSLISLITKAPPIALPGFCSIYSDFFGIIIYFPGLLKTILNLSAVQGGKYSLPNPAVGCAGKGRG